MPARDDARCLPVLGDPHRQPRTTALPAALQTCNCLVRGDDAITKDDRLASRSVLEGGGHAASRPADPGEGRASPPAAPLALRRRATSSPPPRPDAFAASPRARRHAQRSTTPRGARLPHPARQLRPHAAPRRRQCHQDMEARWAARGVGWGNKLRPPIGDRLRSRGRHDRIGRPRRPTSMAWTGTHAHAPSNVTREEIPMAHILVCK